MRRRTLRAGNAAGLTLLEILVVLTIASLLIAAVPWGSFSVLGTVEVKALGHTLASDLRRARAEALRTNAPTRLVIAVEKRRFGIDGETRTRTIPDDVAVEMVTARQDLTRAGEGVVLFLPDGSSNGGEVRFSRDGQAAKVAIRWLTGRVTNHD